MLYKKQRGYRSRWNTIEAYGEIDGEMKFLSATFVLSDLKMYDRNDYEDMIRVIEENKK